MLLVFNKNKNVSYQKSLKFSEKEGGVQFMTFFLPLDLNHQSPQLVNTEYWNQVSCNQ